MISQEKGDIAQGAAISYFMKNGYEVCLPIGDKRTYDMLIEINGNVQKVQVKFAGIYTASDQCKVGLRTTGGNQSYNYSKKYSDNEFDLLFVYTARNDSFLLPWNEITARNEISIEHTKYAKYKITQG